MRIGFLLGGLDSNGGIGRVVSLISNKLVENNEIVIISYYSFNQKNNLYAFNDKVMLSSLNVNESMKKYMIHGGVKKLRNVIVSRNLDILVACGALFFPIAVLACKKTNVKSICWEHSNANNVSDHGFQMFSRKYGATRSDAVVVLTKQDKEIYEKKFKIQRLLQIYNPIDDRIHYSYSKRVNPKKIISVGRLTYQKNYPLLVSVAKKVLDHNPEWIWEIYGEGPDRYSITQLITENGLSSRLILKGQVNNLYSLYGDYSFYVMTSRYEGFGMALLEASGSGLPIISFDVECGPREIIKNGFNGLLIPETDEESMVKAVDLLCMNRELCLTLSENSKQVSNQFNIDSIIMKWKQLFDEIV